MERQKSIGRLSFMTVDQARIAANKLKSDAAQGIDPVQTARIKHASDKAKETAQSFTFDRLLERYSEYIDRQVGAWTLRQSSAAETKRLLRRWQAVLADRPVKDINKADVLGFLNERTAQGTGLVESNNLLITIKKIFKYAVEHDLATINPAVGVAKPLPRQCQP